MKQIYSDLNVYVYSDNRGLFNPGIQPSILDILYYSKSYSIYNDHHYGSLIQFGIFVGHSF